MIDFIAGQMSGMSDEFQALCPRLPFQWVIIALLITLPCSKESGFKKWFVYLIYTQGMKVLA